MAVDSISFKRNGKEVVLNCFSNDDVISYLTLKLNTDVPRFKILAKPKVCNGVMAKLDDTSFIIHAEYTWIELSFNKADTPKMAVVIDEIKKWERFTQTEEKFYVEIDEGNSRSIIFENWFESCEEYRKFFDKYEPKITIF